MFPLVWITRRRIFFSQLISGIVLMPAPSEGCKKECAPVSSQDDPLQYARDKEMTRAGAHGPGIMGYLLGATCQKKGQSGSGVLWRCVSSEPIASEGPGKPRK